MEFEKTKQSLDWSIYQHYFHAHQRALDNDEKYSGCTVHFVNARLDSGKIILQKKVKITNNETKNSLAKKILKQEHKLYPRAILKVFSL